MKKLLFIATVLSTVLSFTSCNEDAPIPMIWEFSNYDREAVSAVYAPDFVNQVAITASPDYSGDITLKCTNYRQVSIIPDYVTGTSDNVEVGYTVSKIDDTTIKVTFKPIEKATDESIYGHVIIEGINGRDTNSTNISIGRVKK
ncbi:hypothetical protein [uncultured Duncaniella sp.]|uniref:hypothetical protein n=1 Tax=uncultured Duncaniella sp. TaxID=2768039 RepID=UPI0025CDA283|nr:hypothetical protein [uncultured Duncaniella sp.]